MKKQAIYSRPISCIIVLLFLSAPTFAVIDYNDGGNHYITTTLSDWVRVDYGLPGVGTFLDLQTNGLITSSLSPYGNSEVHVSGGTVGVWLDARDNSDVLISSGLITFSVRAYDNCQMLITGGTINQYLEPWGNSSVTVSGGTFGLTLLIGQEDNVPWPVHDTSTLTLIGSNFAIDGNPLAPGTYNASDFSSGNITGTLQNGDPLANDFEIWDSASLIIVPEPVTLLLLSIGTFALRKRRTN